MYKNSIKVNGTLSLFNGEYGYNSVKEDFKKSNEIYVATYGLGDKKIY